MMRRLAVAAAIAALALQVPSPGVHAAEALADGSKPPAPRGLLLLLGGGASDEALQRAWTGELLAGAVAPADLTTVVEGAGGEVPSLRNAALGDRAFRTLVCVGCSALPKDVFGFLESGGSPLAV